MNVTEILSQAAEICGTRRELAEHLEVSTASLDKWRREKQIPAKHCFAIYRLTTIPLYKLNPLFRKEVTLGKRWEERIVARLRRLKDRELRRDIEVMLELEAGC